MKKVIKLNAQLYVLPLKRIYFLGLKLQNHPIFLVSQNSITNLYMRYDKGTLYFSLF